MLNSVGEMMPPCGTPVLNGMCGFYMLCRLCIP